MATIAQGQQAGQLAAGLLALQAFMGSMQAAISGGASVGAISILYNGNTAASGFQAVLTPSDSAVLLNALISLAGQLQAGWTNQLTAL